MNTLDIQVPPNFRLELEARFFAARIEVRASLAQNALPIVCQYQFSNGRQARLRAIRPFPGPVRNQALVLRRFGGGDLDDRIDPSRAFLVPLGHERGEHADDRGTQTGEMIVDIVAVN